MKQTIRLTQRELRRMISESVKHVLREWDSDGDFASTGNPYGFENEDEDDDFTLDGIYGTFSNISVEIKNDGKPNVHIWVETKYGNEKQSFEGEEAQRILDKIRYEAENVYDSKNTAIYRNLYQYVL